MVTVSVEHEGLGRTPSLRTSLGPACCGHHGLGFSLPFLSFIQLAHEETCLGQALSPKSLPGLADSYQQ